MESRKNQTSRKVECVEEYKKLYGYENLRIYDLRALLDFEAHRRLS